MPWQAELFTEAPPLSDDERSCTIALGDRIVPYVLKRSHRRSIGLTIDQRGLRVGAPRRSTLSEVEALIRKHGDWVTQKLDEWRTRRRPAASPVTDGMPLPMLGLPLQIRLSTGNNRFARHEETPPVLTLFLRSPDQAGRILEKAMRQEALAHFSQRVAHFAGLMNLAQPPLALSSARTRWGSCSRKSGIRLNWRLIHFPPDIVDYVVVHELAHLREMNHSERFWAIVEMFCPEHRRHRAELNRLAATCPTWAS